jgi:hypothetical protein
MTHQPSPPRLGIAAHLVALALLRGLFVASWYVWATRWLNGLVPGRRIPWILPATSLAAAALAWVALLAGRLGAAPVVELVTESTWIVLLLLAGGFLVNLAIAFRARAILKAHLDRTLPLGVDVSWFWTLLLQNVYLQHVINVYTALEESDAWSSAA